MEGAGANSGLVSPSPQVESNPAFAKTLRWLTVYAGFPASRLAAPAELLVCAAALAHAEEADERGSFQLQRRVSREEAALRSHTLRRSHAQFKSDNSSKV